eukprot:SAG31_NODE_10215_length_1169_cov_1.772897_2_plen_111_part_00
MDQITYPHRFKPAERTPEMETEMRRLLKLVGIEFLVGREGTENTSGWDAERVWEDTLSLGEQQRLGMARMYFNAGRRPAGDPKFAILDECTSAVSVTLTMLTQSLCVRKF